MSNTANETTINTAADVAETEAVMAEVEGTEVEAKPLNHVELKIAGFRQQLLSDNASLTMFQVQGWEVLWRQIAAAYELGKIILDPANEADFKKALENCGITTTKMTQKWVSVTKLLYGEWKDSNGDLAPWDNALNTIFELDRSAEKYSTYFRYFEANNIHVSDVFSTIKTFDDPVHGRHLKGIEAKYRAGNKSSAAGISDNDAEALGSRVDVNDVVSFDKPKGFSVEMGTAFFKVENGKIHLLGVAELTEDAFTKRAVTRGKKLFADNRKEVEKAAAVRAVADMLTKQAA